LARTYQKIWDQRPHFQAASLFCDCMPTG
jgi:hypothetical protein